MELQAPNGWKKMLTPKKIGASKRNEVVFLSPSDEEIKSKRQLDRYLKSHPGGPPLSEFDWSAGETPRRSKRISEKSNATETPEKEPPRKKQSQLHSKKGAEQKKDDINGQGDAEEKDDAVVGEEAKASEEVMIDAVDVGEKSKGETCTEELVTAGDTKKDSEQKTKERVDEMSVEKSANLETANKATSDSAGEQVMDNLVPTPGLEKTEEVEKQRAGDAPLKMEIKEAGNKTTWDAKEEQVGSDLTLGPEDNKEQPEKQPARPEAPPFLSAENKTVSSEEEVKDLKYASFEVDAKVEKEPEETTVRKEDSLVRQALPGKSVGAEETKVDNSSVKETKDGSKPMDNQAAIC